MVPYAGKFGFGLLIKLMSFDLIFLEGAAYTILVKELDKNFSSHSEPTSLHVLNNITLMKIWYLLTYFYAKLILLESGQETCASLN
jgi:hypothetical protein